MKSRLCTCFLLLVLLPAIAFTQELKPIILPAPQMEGGKPLMQALRERHSSREFSPEKLPPQVLSNLLWAAFGINRPATGKRTAPSALNWQEIDVYVATADGLYVYDAKGNKLNPILAGDVRSAAGTQSYVKDAPLNLVYIADMSKTGNGPAEEKSMYTAVDAGVIAQNVYLFCASEGLAVVVRGGVDRVAASRVFKLRPEQKIILAQTVGYPKK